MMFLRFGGDGRSDGKRREEEKEKARKSIIRSLLPLVTGAGHAYMALCICARSL